MLDASLSELVMILYDTSLISAGYVTIGMHEVYQLLSYGLVDWLRNGYTNNGVTDKLTCVQNLRETLTENREINV